MKLTNFELTKKFKKYSIRKPLILLQLYERILIVLILEYRNYESSESMQQMALNIQHLQI